PVGRGGTPFGPFLTLFPTRMGDRMVDAIVSDYALNSLLYWAYKCATCRKGAIAVRVGPETPKIGEFLKTSCVRVLLHRSSRRRQQSSEQRRRRVGKRPKIQD
ncbi:hypothetical protein PMAYCL1PPCAC_17222, partial [Pristionchus mayeri]